MKTTTANEVTMQRLLDVTQAATYLGIAAQTLRQHRRDIPRIIIGRRVLYDPADLESYIRANRHPAQGKAGE